VTRPRRPLSLASRAGLSALLLLAAADARAEDAGSPPPASSPAQSAPEPVDDLEVDRAEPDFNVVNLPTNLRIARHKLAFRVTHRFARPLGQGDFSDLLADFFGFDGGAQIGLGLRFGLFTGTQLAFYRTSDRTIQFSLQQELLAHAGHPVGISVVGSVEGLDNFGEEYSPALAVVVSRKLGRHGAVYAVPSWVGNTNLVGEPVSADESSLVLGLGARVLVSDSVALVAEYHPRLAGYRGDRGSGDRKALLGFGIEKRVGGHAFQLNFSNDLGTTPAQTARGQQGADDWFIGFNISRRFY